jgi:hypothetical protein
MAKKNPPPSNRGRRLSAESGQKKFLLPFQPLGAVLKAVLFKQNPSSPVKLKIAFSFKIG